MLRAQSLAKEIIDAQQCTEAEDEEFEEYEAFEHFEQDKEIADKVVDVYEEDTSNFSPNIYETPNTSFYKMTTRSMKPITPSTPSPTSTAQQQSQHMNSQYSFENSYLI